MRRRASAASRRCTKASPDTSSALVVFLAPRRHPGACRAPARQLRSLERRRYSHMPVRSTVGSSSSPRYCRAPAPAAAQIRAETSSGRKATTLGALTAYAGFYHLQAVRVRAKLVTDQVGTALLSGETRMLAVGDAATAQVDWRCRGDRDVHRRRPSHAGRPAGRHPRAGRVVAEGPAA